MRAPNIASAPEARNRKATPTLEWDTEARTRPPDESMPQAVVVALTPSQALPDSLAIALLRAAAGIDDARSDPQHARGRTESTAPPLRTRTAPATAHNRRHWHPLKLHGLLAADMINLRAVCGRATESTAKPDFRGKCLGGTNAGVRGGNGRSRGGTHKAARSRS